ncbi:MAG: TRAP transporter small permease [Saccharofermentanales bacterium]|jgi:TRAP-type C4-dicarboxylate transport system permease small subunit
MREKIENFFLWKWFLSIQRFVMVISSIGVLITIFSSVICRYILKINFAGSDEILIIFALWLYYVGGLYGNWSDEHIKADVMTMITSKEKVLRIVNIIVRTITLAISIGLAIWAIEYAQFCLKIGGNSLVYKIPMIVPRSAIIFGYTAPVLYNIYHFILSIVECVRPPKVPAPDLDEKTTQAGGEIK